jgi:hypothetical protein
MSRERTEKVRPGTGRETGLSHPFLGQGKKMDPGSSPGRRGGLVARYVGGLVALDGEGLPVSWATTVMMLS